MGWIQTLGVLGLALAGAYLGRWLSRLRSPYWALGFAVALPLILAVVLTRHLPELAFVAPFSWLAADRTEFRTLAFAAALVLTTARPRLRPRDRRAVWILLVILVGYAASPFLASAVVEGTLSRLETRMTADGVCRQSNGWTCGPAAAVTAVRRLGLPAEEGELAILMGTTPTGGTSVDSLVLALRRRYARDGLSAEYRRFRDVDDLRTIGGSAVVIAVVKHSFLVDHYVTVMEVRAGEVIVGDPLRGRRSLSHAEFLDIWRRSGVVVARRR